MTSSLPAGDGLSTGAGPSPALDEDEGPATGNEPDTARAAAGEHRVSAAEDDGDDAPGDSGAPDASAAAAPAAPDAAGPRQGDSSTAAGAVEGLDPAQARDSLDPDSHRRAADKVELDGPALENDEMRKATEDLQASQQASAEAREFAADVRQQTLPGTSPTGV